MSWKVVLVPQNPDDKITPFQPEILAYLRRLGLDPETARDLCQDVFVKAVEQSPSFDENFNVRAWLYKVARNTTFNHFKYKKVRKGEMVVDFNDPNLPEPGADRPGTGQPVAGQTNAWDDTADRVAGVLESIPDRYSDVLEMRDFKGYSYREIAEKLDLTESAVTSLISRARSRFREAYLTQIAPQWTRALGASYQKDVLKKINPFSSPDSLQDDLKIQIKKYYARIHRSWDDVRDSFFARELLDWVIAGIPARESDFVLDLGTGTGIMALALAGRTTYAVGLDNNPRMLAIAQEKAADLGVANVEFIHGDFEDLARSVDRRFDLVVANLAIHHATVPGKVFKNIYDLLPEGGRFAVSDLLRHEDETMWDDMKDLWLGFGVKQIEKWLKKAGFKQVTSDSFPLSQAPRMKKYKIPGIFMAVAVK